MKTLKPTIYMIYGLYGSGKTNALFKLCYYKLKENIPEQKMAFVSANYCTMGQHEICKEFCKIIKIPFISRTEINGCLKDYPFEPDTMYFIDFGSSLKDQKDIYNFFNSEKFNFFPIITIPAFMDFSVAENVLSRFSFIESPKIILTFCDYVSKKRINDFDNTLTQLNQLNAKVIGLNGSFYLNKGLVLKIYWQ